MPLFPSACKTAVTSYIDTEDGGEFAFKFLLGHGEHLFRNYGNGLWGLSQLNDFDILELLVMNVAQH